MFISQTKNVPKQYFVNLTETNTRTFNVVVEPYQVLPQGIRTRASSVAASLSLSVLIALL